MNDIDLKLEEIRNKLDEIEHKIDQLKISHQTVVSIWDDNSFRPTELKEIESEPIKPTKNFPHLIIKDKYKEDNRYAKIEIIYYEIDGIFATFDGKLVEYLNEEYFGFDNLSLFDTGCNIYLRDETIHVDYHMVYEGCTSYFAEHKGE